MDLRRLIEHMAWADLGARSEVASMAPDSPEASRARTIYAHLASAEHVWISRLRGERPRHDVWPDLTLAEAYDLASTSVEDLGRFVSGASQVDLVREVSYRNSTGRAFTNRAIDIVLHVALHGAYHRGQLALLARMAGGDPVSTDFIAYLREAGDPLHG